MSFVETVFAAFRVRDASMAPTILFGEFVNTETAIGEYHRGDLVVCQLPGWKKGAAERIVATGGETVDVENGHVSVDGQELSLVADGPCNIESEANRRWTTDTADCFRETNAGKTYRVAFSPTRPAHHPPLHVILSPDTFFVMADNRDNAFDSRQFGAVPLAKVRSRLTTVWISSGPRGSRKERRGIMLE
jgi:signal peptidase I